MIITNKKEYLQALNLLEKIWGAPSESSDGKLLEVLIDQIEAWEEKHYPIPEPSLEEAKKFREEQEQELICQMCGSNVRNVLEECSTCFGEELLNKW